MQQRNRLLADGVRDDARFEGLERIMAETGVADCRRPRRGRRRACRPRSARAATRDPASPFPWAEPGARGHARSGSRSACPPSTWRTTTPAAARRRASATAPPGARSTARTAPTSWSAHGPKEMPAAVCSTGEQKALLIGLVLAHASSSRRRREGVAPILLLDEVDGPSRRGAARRAVRRNRCVLGSQAWMTGTDPEAFSALAERAQFRRVEEGVVTASSLTIPRGPFSAAS